MIFWIIAALCAFYVKGLCGFANTLVFTSILSFGNANINISPIELILGYPTNLIISFKERKSIDLKICLPLAERNLLLKQSARVLEFRKRNSFLEERVERRVING